MGYGKLSEDQLRILEDLPGSAVELQAKDKVSFQSISYLLNFRIKNTLFLYLSPLIFMFSIQLLRKLNRQERVVEEVKLVLKPHYNKKHITKEEYKEIMRRSVPKVYFVTRHKRSFFLIFKFINFRFVTIALVK